MTRAVIGTMTMARSVIKPVIVPVVEVVTVTEAAVDGQAGARYGERGTRPIVARVVAVGRWCNDHWRRDNDRRRRHDGRNADIEADSDAGLSRRRGQQEAGGDDRKAGQPLYAF